MHCHFLIAATAETPIYYHVDHVSDGERLMTCAVKAKQRNHLIFTATVSFINKHSRMDEKVLEHPRPKPDLSVPRDTAVITGEGTGNGLFESRIVDSDIGRYYQISLARCDAEIAYNKTTVFKLPNR
jgi:acyl-CoA thioesterase 8